MGIGKRIKEARIKKGFSQETLAKMVNVSKGTIGNYEIDLSSPNEKTLIALMDCLGVDANFLYQDDMSQDMKRKIQIQSLSDAALEAGKAYDNAIPAIQAAVDRLLMVENQTDTVRVFRAARSQDNKPPQMVEISREQMERIERGPDVDKI